MTLPLHRAVIDGDRDAVSRLLAGGAQVNQRGPGGHTPLDLASLWGHEAIADLLLAAGADPNAPDRHGFPPLQRAIERRQATLIASLLAHGADASATDGDGTTALHLAMADGDRRLVAMLLERGADATVPDARGLTPVDLAADAEVFALGIGSDAAPEDIAALIAAQTAFGAALHLRAAADAGDLCTAPIGAALALMMSWAGARGETRRELAECLHLPALETDRLQAAAGALASALQAPGVELAFASALFADARLPIEVEFADALTTRYRAAVRRLDFARPVDASAAINAWIAARTRGLIDGAIAAQDISPAMPFIIANALYFKGAWARTFDRDDTVAAPFTQLDGRSLPTSLMYQRGAFNLIAIDDGLALELPYVGGAIAMVVLLPTRTDGFSALEAALPAQLGNWLRRLDAASAAGPYGFRAVDVYLPRFRAECRLDLKPPLRQLGVHRAFDASADFTGIAADVRPLFVGTITQRAMIDVDEEGTTAAAVTLESGAMGSPPPPPPVFRADRPFVFLIRDQRTGVVLMMGRIVNAPPPPPEPPRAAQRAARTAHDRSPVVPGPEFGAASAPEETAMLKKVGIGLSALVLLLVIAIALQPAHFAIQRATTIQAPPAAVIAEIQDLRAWEAWSPWAKSDPQMRQSYAGPAAGVGAESSWEGPKAGKGRMTITAVKPDQEVDIALQFVEPMKADNTVVFTLAPDAGGTTVTWRMEGDNGFIGKAFSLFADLDTMVGADFERGLAALKSVVERGRPQG